MIKRLLYILILSVGGALMINSCKSTKGISEKSTTLSAEDKLEQIVNGYGEWETVSVSGKVALSGFSSAIKVQMVRNQSISLSIRPLLGIEVGKVLLKGDSIYIMDKMNRRYIIRALGDVSDKLNINISSIQDMLTNRIFLANGEIGRVDKSFDIKQLPNTSYWSAETTDSSDSLLYKFIFDDMNLTELTINPTLNPKLVTLMVKYTDFVATKCGVVASDVYMSAEMGDKKLGVNISINSSSIVYDSEINEEFKVGANYTEISGSALLNMLKNYQ